MEIILAALIAHAMPAIGMALTGLVGWGISLLKQRTQSDLARNALDQVDQVVGTVVGGLAQTTAKELRAAAADGHLSAEDRLKLKQFALVQSQALLTVEVVAAAGRSVTNLEDYVARKIEEQVAAGKRQ